MSADQQPSVRVRLSAITTSATVSCDAELQVKAAGNERRTDRAFVVLRRVGNSVVVTVGNNEWQRTTDTVILKGVRNVPVRVGGQAYRGMVLAFVSADELVVVNEIGLEDYLYSVVPCEIGPIRPETFEAVKAQAVAARSFTLARLGKRKALGFDLYDTYLRDQEYQGVGRETELSTRAVVETRGEVLLFDGKPAEALYHCNCGGITAQGSQPYLKPVRDTPEHRPGRPFCADGKYHEWQAEFEPIQYDTILTRLVGVGAKIKLRRVKLQKDKVSGRVLSLILDTDKGRFKVFGTDFRMALGLRSTMFDLKLSAGRMNVTGRGWGHGCGLCQDGAIEMARRGSSYRQILAHYYPGLKLGQQY